MGRQYIEIIIRIIFRCFYRMFFFLPVNPKRIVFQSYEKAVGYNCNPKYLCEYLKQNCEGRYELVWIFQKPNDFNEILGITKVRDKTLKWLFYMVTARVIVVNTGPRPYLMKRNGQYIIQTWHGGGAYKSVGIGKQNVDLLTKWSYERSAELIDLFLSSSERFTDVLIHKGYGYQKEIFNCGMPRNDILLNHQLVAKTSREVRDKLNIKGYVILYAPTFRNEGGDNTRLKKSLHYSKLISAAQKRFNTDITILVRAHRYDQDSADVLEHVIDVSNYSDMQELLCAADMLITDYSSSMWDFALLGRPCILYVPDLEKYINADRGIETPVEEWPGLICKEEDKIYQAVEVLDEEECFRRAKDHLRRMHSYECGNATERVCKKIIRLMDSN